MRNFRHADCKGSIQEKLEWVLFTSLAENSKRAEYHGIQLDGVGPPYFGDFTKYVLRSIRL